MHGLVVGLGSAASHLTYEAPVSVLGDLPWGERATS
jgi:hypothetical protein